MNPNRVKEILEYVKGSPETMDYGRWGALNPQQRDLIKKLCNSWLVLNDATNMQTKEIERLKKELEIEKDISDGMLETIDEAIEYIEKNKVDLSWFMTTDKDLKLEGISNVVSTFRLLEILKKEVNNEPSNIDRETN